jgi:hypothetical protein
MSIKRPGDAIRERDLSGFFGEDFLARWGLP